MQVASLATALDVTMSKCYRDNNPARPNNNGDVAERLRHLVFSQEIEGSNPFIPYFKTYRTVNDSTLSGFNGVTAVAVLITKKGGCMIAFIAVFVLGAMFGVFILVVFSMSGS